MTAAPQGRDQRIAVVGSDEHAVDQVVQLRRLSDDITLFLHEAPEPTDEQWEQLAALGVRVVVPRVQRLVEDGAQVRGVEIEGGRTFDADAVVVAPRSGAAVDLAGLATGVGARREPFSAAMEALVSEVVLGDRRHGL